MSSPSAVTLLTLFSMFSSLSDAQLRPSPAVSRLIERLPTEQFVYEAIAAELVDEGLQSEKQRERYDRLVAILRLLLYEDGRSERALYRLIDEAVAHHSTEPLGINPLAALANYYHAGGNSVIPEHLLRERLGQYEGHEPLFNNAMACKRNLRRVRHK